MKKALSLAKRGVGKTHPNPYVGSLLVCGDRIVGQGYHRGFGLPHAEVEAMLDFKKRKEVKNIGMEDFTLYCTLEPCNHYGKTSPCTEAIISHKPLIKRVVIGVMDPNPLVSGKGMKRLSSSGIEISVDVLENSCKELNEDYFKWVHKKIPYVVLKAAITIDGKIAARDGSSKWISSKDSLPFAHRLRARADAIMVGVNTVIKDNPKLTARDRHDRIIKEPLRVVLDSGLKIPTTSIVVNVDYAKKTWIFCDFAHDDQKRRYLESRGVKVFPVNKALDRDGLDIHTILEVLGKADIVNLLVEGGGRVLTNFVKHQLYDTIFVGIAPKILGSSGMSVFGDLDISNIDQALRLEFVHLKHKESDILVGLRRS